MRLQNEFVFACANELLCKAKTTYGYDLEILRSAHEAVLRAALELLLSSYGRLSYEHICRAAGCVFMGGSLSLPGDIVLEAKQDALTVRKNRERKDRNGVFGSAESGRKRASERENAVCGEKNSRKRRNQPESS